MLNENNVEEKHQVGHIHFSAEQVCSYDVEPNVVGNIEIGKYIH